VRKLAGAFFCHRSIGFTVQRIVWRITPLSVENSAVLVLNSLMIRTKRGRV
jgi:hypothetical protein